MKILVNRRPVQGPWGGGNLFVRAICDRIVEKGHKLVHNLEEGIDSILVVDPRPESGFDAIEAIINYSHQRRAKTTLRVNECDARKGTSGLDSYLKEVGSYMSHTVFVSNWMRDYHLGNGWAGSHSVIYNGVDRNIFRSREKIGNGKINLVTHHWSNNRMKGFDLYEKLDSLVASDERFTFTYIGRDLGTFKNTNVVQPLFGLSLGEELSRYDVYVSASIKDPGPNHIIESIACGLPTYATSDGGGACEFVGSDWVFNDLNQLLSMIENPRKNSDPFRDWKTCADQFLEQIL